MVYYGVNRITSPELARLFFPQVHWSLGRVTELYLHIDADAVYELSTVDNIPRYERLENEEDN